MPDIHLEFSVEDRFSQQMDAFEKRLSALEKGENTLNRTEEKLEKTTRDTGSAAAGAGGMFKGFGAAMFLANQAMQGFMKLAESVKGALDDISRKEQAIAMLGPEAGRALADFAHDASRELGRSRADIMNAAMRWKRTGIGGADIMEMTAIADRFANLNPDRSYEDVATALNDAVKGKDVGGLAELLGGGEGVERALRRAGVERKLRRGDVTGAMDAFKTVADGFDYTQDKADKMGNTISRKVEKITGRVKDRVTEMFGNIVSRAEPYIDRVMAWINSEEFERFFNNVESGIMAVVDIAGSAIDTVGSMIDEFCDWFNKAGDELTGETTTMTEKMVGIFVGGFTTIGAVVVDIFAGIWNTIVEGAAHTVKAIRFWKEYLDPESSFNKSKEARDRTLELLNGQNMLMDYANTMMEMGNVEAASSALDAAREMQDAAKNAHDDADSLWKQYEGKFSIDSDKYKIDYLDPVDLAAKNIKDVMDYLNSAEVDRNREQRETNKTLKKMAPELSKIRGAMTHEQDLRWLKEQAEQRYINNVNVRQLTPTVNVRVATNASPDEIGRAVKRVLDEQSSAGTWNSYGEAV